MLCAVCCVLCAVCCVLCAVTVPWLHPPDPDLSIHDSSQVLLELLYVAGACMLADLKVRI